MPSRMCRSINQIGNEIIRRNMGTTVHSAGIAEVHLMPISAIYRPIQPVLNNDKVNSLMRALQCPVERDTIPPIDVLWITGSEGGNYYFSFGGCHRYAAHVNLGLTEINAKLIKGTLTELTLLMGSSAPKILK